VRKVRSLRVRFVLAISALVALVLLANGLVLALASRDHISEDIESRALAFAQLAAEPVSNAYATYYSSGYSKFRELVQEASRLDPDLARLSIYDTGGRLLFDTSELATAPAEPARAAASVPAGATLLQAVRGMTLASWRTHAPAAPVAAAPAALARPGEPVFVVVAPFVEEWGGHRYSVAFYFVYDSLRAAAKAAGWRIVGLSAGSLALGALIAVLLSSQSVGPLEALTRGAQDLADGHLARRIDLHTGDEFGTLAATFNQMAARLERTVSDLAASNQALEAMNLELQELDRMKSDLLANVSHELRTPLTAIQGYTEAMDEGLLGAVNLPQRDAFMVVRRNTRRLLEMIERLLSFSRLEAGAVTLASAPFDLAEVALHVVGSVRAGGPPRLDLRLEIAPALPPVWGDPERISQVIENLVTNAVKFTPPGREIRVRVGRLGDEAEVAVTDRGIGIPPAARARIFDRFYQVDASSTRRYGGMGLGLAIAREILAAHQREIQVESEVGVGTTFRFTLPLAAAATGARAAADEPWAARREGLG
jgi:signal transduction histidine kinase